MSNKPFEVGTDDYKAILDIEAGIYLIPNSMRDVPIIHLSAKMVRQIVQQQA